MCLLKYKVIVPSKHLAANKLKCSPPLWIHTKYLGLKVGTKSARAAWLVGLQARRLCESVAEHNSAEHQGQAMFQQVPGHVLNVRFLKPELKLEHPQNGKALCRLTRSHPTRYLTTVLPTKIKYVSCFLKKLGSNSLVRALLQGSSSPSGGGSFLEDA